MMDSVAAGRRQAGRAIAWQAAVTLLTSLACLWFGWKAGAAALVGGTAVLLGGWIAARIGLGGGITGAVPAMARLLAGMLAKWFVLVALMVIGVAAMGLPPLPMLAAALATLVAQVLALARHP
ncbi:hypothetical protein CSC68_11475 [Pseudoxanthomonas suwonensis]|nr:hypothetical protein CSC68_11475 [Pseudoxanthomonas suwonensis]